VMLVLEEMEHANKARREDPRRDRRATARDRRMYHFTARSRKARELCGRCARSALTRAAWSWTESGYINRTWHLDEAQRRRVTQGHPSSLRRPRPQARGQLDEVRARAPARRRRGRSRRRPASSTLAAACCAHDQSSTNQDPECGPRTTSLTLGPQGHDINSRRLELVREFAATNADLCDTKAQRATKEMSLAASLISRNSGPRRGRPWASSPSRCSSTRASPRNLAADSLDLRRAASRPWRTSTYVELPESRSSR